MQTGAEDNITDEDEGPCLNFKVCGYWEQEHLSRPAPQVPVCQVSDHEELVSTGKGLSR